MLHFQRKIQAYNTIEIIIVISMVGILSIVAINAYRGYKASAQLGNSYANLAGIIQNYAGGLIGIEDVCGSGSCPSGVKEITSGCIGGGKYGLKIIFDGSKISGSIAGSGESDPFLVVTTSVADVGGVSTGNVEYTYITNMDLEFAKKGLGISRNISYVDTMPDGICLGGGASGSRPGDSSRPLYEFCFSATGSVSKQLLSSHGGC